MKYGEAEQMPSSWHMASAFLIPESSMTSILPPKGYELIHGRQRKNLTVYEESAGYTYST